MLPKGNGRAGVVVQAIGSGLGISLVKYLEKIRSIELIRNCPAIVLVDRREVANRLCQIISEKSDIRPVISRTKGEFVNFVSSRESGVVVAEIRNVDPSVLVGVGAVFVGYNLHSVTKKLSSILPLGVSILFANTLPSMARETFGDLVGAYDLHKAILHDVAKPVVIEKVNLSLDDVVELDRVSRGERGKGVGNFQTSRSYLRACAVEIVRHFEFRQERLHGKAVVVVRNSRAAKILFECMLELRPSWQGEESRGNVVSAISSGGSVDESGFLLSEFNGKNGLLSLLIGTGSYLSDHGNRYINTVYVTCSVSSRLRQRVSALVSLYDVNKPYGVIVDFVGLDWSVGCHL